MKKKTTSGRSIEEMTRPTDTGPFNHAPSENIVSDGFVLIRNLSAIEKGWVQQGQPTLTSGYRVIRIASGEADFLINLNAYHLRAGSVVVLTPGNVLEVENLGTQLQGAGFGIHELPSPGIFECMHLHPSEIELEKIDAFLNLFFLLLKDGDLDTATLPQLSLALFSYLQRIGQAHRDIAGESHTGREEQIFNRFMELLNQYGDKYRRIPFYAAQLYLSPNRLSAVVKSYSGKTVMDWIDRRSVQMAKALLRYTDKPVYEIAEQLGFSSPAFFSKFFSKYTGMTPKEYRSDKG